MLLLGGLLGMMLLPPTQANGQQTPPVLQVSVTAAESGQPVKGAEVQLVSSRRVYRTGSDGTSRLAGLGAGADTVVVQHARYAPARVPVLLSAGDTFRISVELNARAVQLEGLTVRERMRARSPRLREFYDRAERASRGYFITRDQIDKQRGAKFSDILRRVPNLQMIHIGNGLYKPRFNRALASLRDRDCPIKYYLDGIEIPESPSNPDFEFEMEEIEGLEVYPGTYVPAQFGGSKAGCGVIVIWTRERA